MVAVVSRLRAYRRAAGMTQAQVAELVGVNQSSVSDMERGASNPTLWTLVAYAAAVGVVLVPMPADEVG